MVKQTRSGIVISAYYHLEQALGDYDVKYCISILSRSEVEALPWPSFGDRLSLRLQFDDIIVDCGALLAASPKQVSELINFARQWAGKGILLVHCRAGVSRSSAAGLIAAKVVGANRDKLRQVARGRTYFRPNETLLRHADALLRPEPKLIELIRSLPFPDRQDDWAPTFIPLD